MIKFTTIAAAAPLAHAGEGTFRPGTHALGLSGAPAQTAAPHAFPTCNDGMGGGMRLGRPAASVMGPAGQ
jgi:hypothetical protein